MLTLLDKNHLKNLNIMWIRRENVWLFGNRIAMQFTKAFIITQLSKEIFITNHWDFFFLKVSNLSIEIFVYLTMPERWVLRPILGEFRSLISPKMLILFRSKISKNASFQAPALAKMRHYQGHGKSKKVYFFSGALNYQKGSTSGPEKANMVDRF